MTPAFALLASPARWGDRPGTRKRPRIRLRRAVLLLLLALLLPSDGHLGPARINFAVSRAIGGDGFPFVAWEAQAIGQAVRDTARRPEAGLTPQEQHDLVLAYFDAVGRVDRLAGEIERIYADPDQADPAGAAAAQQAELDALRAVQEARRPAAQRILEQQVGAALADLGLSSAGHVWPPVRFQFTESPHYLILSPRDRIAVAKGVYLDPALPVAEMERIETQLEAGLEMSALVDGTGGFSSYPTMVLAYSAPDWVIDTVAHEWLHTYMAFRPLGWRYYDSGAMRTINETVASIVGEEVSHAVMVRFYPDRVRPRPWPRPLSMRRDWLNPDAADGDFDFGAFMRSTRLEVDRLLAAGQVTEAEAFMETQRRVLVEHGYGIRKLNQAYFAFHGSYAVGSAATDPIGGKLRLLRQRSGSLAEFVRIVAEFVNPADLDAALS